MSSLNMNVKRIIDSLRINPEQQINDFGSDVLSGEVTSINPLKIKIDVNWILDEDYLTVSILCKETKLWEGLKVGDLVSMIKMSGNQKYYVIENKEMRFK